MGVAQGASVINYHGPYVGLMTGYAETTWHNLVSKDTAGLVSTPNSVDEGGLMLGGYVGYDVLPGLAFQLGYLHIPRANVSFAADSVYAIVDGVLVMKTKTDAVVLSTKMSTSISDHWRLFGKIGVEATRRLDKVTTRFAGAISQKDTLAHYRWRIGAVFGAGFSYAINSRWSSNIGFDYLTGYGESEVRPVDHYTPFVYAAYGSISYHFTV